MQSTHLVLLSVHENTITPDDAMKLLLPEYDGHKVLGLEDGIPTADDFTELIHNLLDTEGVAYIKEMFTDWDVCRMCGKLTLWDNVLESPVHLQRQYDCGISDSEEESLHKAPVA